MSGLDRSLYQAAPASESTHGANSPNRARARWICQTSICAVDWRATASPTTVESTTRRALPLNAPDAAANSATFAKTRSGSALNLTRRR
jgi:hypothetical protein